MFRRPALSGRRRVHRKDSLRSSPPSTRAILSLETLSQEAAWKVRPQPETRRRELRRDRRRRCEEGPVKITIYGTHCACTQEIYDQVMSFLAEKGLQAELELVTEPGRLAEAGANGIPALEVDGVMVVEGRAPLRAELESLLGPPKIDRWWTRSKRGCGGQSR